MNDTDYYALAAQVASARAEVASFGYAYSNMTPEQTADLAMAEALRDKLCWALKKAAEKRVEVAA